MISSPESIPLAWRGGKYGDGSHDIEIDGRIFRCSDRLSGGSLLALVGRDSRYLLYEVRNSPEGYVQDRLVSNLDVVELHDGSTFFTIPAITF